VSHHLWGVKVLQFSTSAFFSGKKKNLVGILMDQKGIIPNHFKSVMKNLKKKLRKTEIFTQSHLST